MRWVHTSWHGDEIQGPFQIHSGVLWFHHLWETQPKGRQDTKSWTEVLVWELWEVMATFIYRSHLQWEQSVETWGHLRAADSKGICERDLKFLIASRKNNPSLLTPTLLYF